MVWYNSEQIIVQFSDRGVVTVIGVLVVPSSFHVARFKRKAAYSLNHPSIRNDNMAGANYVYAMYTPLHPINLVTVVSYNDIDLGQPWLS